MRIHRFETVKRILSDLFLTIPSFTNAALQFQLDVSRLRVWTLRVSSAMTVTLQFMKAAASTLHR